MKKYAIIVAGGEGRRVGGDLPKQFIEIAGKPMLYHTLRAFYNADPETELIVVLHPEFIEDWEQYMRKLPEQERIPFTPICGGMSRTHSVFNGLYEIRKDTDSLVAIHDAARPLITSEMLQRGWKCAETNGTAVPVIDETNSLRRVEPDGNSVTVNRSRYKVVQTPQIFKTGLILEAYDKVGIDMQSISHPGQLHGIFTDDASVAEAAGFMIALYQGDPRNIKVTTPIDLKIAGYILQNLEF